MKLTELGHKHILIWKRFIDDVFIIWTGEFTTYIGTANTLHSTIKFTYKVSKHEPTFLDSTVYKRTRFKDLNILDTRTHIKPTNKQLYVHATSYHPPTTKEAIAKGESKRYLRTKSDEKEFRKMTTNLIYKLKHVVWDHRLVCLGL